MRKMVWPLVATAALALAGCNGSDSQQSGDGQAALAHEVKGTVAVRGDAQLSPAAKLEVSLVDVSTQGAAPLASKTIQPVQLPAQFQLDVNPANVNPSDLYVVQALLTDGDRQYTMPLQAPVLTKGAAAQVSIQLVGQQTPGEKELAAFKDVQAHIGAMKMTNGTKLEKDASRGWQVFRQDGEVKFIRELVDYGDKGFTSTDFAYKGGKPWVVVQQKKASKDAKPSETDRAGWNDAGALVLKQHEADGKTDALGDDAAAGLQKQAQDILGMATGGKGK
jgi:putative lipoprotein